MSTTLDGQSVFDEHRLEINAGSVHRDSIERVAAGVDGVVSIDLGKRGREIKQVGILRAVSNSVMDDRIEVISGYMDGDTHTLVTSGGEQYQNLRMDSFKITQRQIAGVVSCEYEIVYTQLVV